MLYELVKKTTELCCPELRAMFTRKKLVSGGAGFILPNTKTTLARVKKHNLVMINIFSRRVYKYI